MPVLTDEKRTTRRLPRAMLALAGALLLAAALPTTVWAQFAPGTRQTGPNIVIDLSVLDDLRRDTQTAPAQQTPPPTTTAPTAPSATAPSSPPPDGRIDESEVIRLGLLPSPRPPAPPRRPSAPPPTTRTPSLSALPDPDLSPPPPPPTPPAAPAADAATGAATADPAPDTPPGGAPDEDGEAVLSVVFAPGSAILPDGYKDALREIAATLSANPQLRLRLLAYADKQDQNELFARRLSLSRSLAVRNFLISSDIEEARITVQALGASGDSEQPDRVDAFYVRR